MTIERNNSNGRRRKPIGLGDIQSGDKKFKLCLWLMALWGFMHTMRMKGQWSVNYQGCRLRKLHALPCAQLYNLRSQQGQNFWTPFRTLLREWDFWEGCWFTTQELPLPLSGSEAGGPEEVFTLRQAGEIPQQLRVLVSLVKHLLSVPALHQAAHPHL